MLEFIYLEAFSIEIPNFLQTLMFLELWLALPNSDILFHKMHPVKDLQVLHFHVRWYEMSRCF